MRKTILLLAVFLIAFTEIFAQGNKQQDLEYLYRDKPIYEVNIPTYFREYDISDSAIKAEIPRGSKVKVINSFFKKKWEVLYQGERGWVTGSDLKFYEPGMKNESETNALDSLHRNQPIYFVKNKTYLKEHMSHQSATLANVPRGVKVRVINSFFNDWWEVLYDNRRGNLPKNLLSYEEISPIQVQVQSQPQSPTFSDPQPQPKSQSISNTSFNTIKYSKRVSKSTSLRESSDSKSKVILRFKAGNKVSVIDDSGKWWAKVIYKERVGWVKKSVLTD
ncbi:MAG: SH3 domain-containing protein [Saprospiraceae bacterium]